MISFFVSLVKKVPIKEIFSSPVTITHTGCFFQGNDDITFRPVLIYRAAADGKKQPNP